ncbi:uncharacterized protein LOC127240907 [Andrographis paniculata]|uniref:uncharacterized protein LOC127240907 n=1 Tax=Andrographis paniculata TaxID=175694 RepID=UPI0021E86D5F|nr:uncharacterized protein LOC127240907 [Andrographis paniculata]
MAEQEIGGDSELSTYSDAIQCDESIKWIAVMNEEIVSLHKNNTLVLVKPPPDKRIIGSKWVFKKKDGIPRGDKFADGTRIYLLLNVDDMLIAAKNMSEIHSMKLQLSSEFEMKDLGVTKKILSMDIQRDRGQRRLVLTQESYVKKSPQSIEEEEDMVWVPYSNAVNSLMYAMVRRGDGQILESTNERPECCRIMKWNTTTDKRFSGR